MCSNSGRKNMNFLMSFLGRFLAFIPRSFAKSLCDGIGWLVAEFPSPRRRVIRANLRHCFPDMDEGKLRRVSIESCRRTIEMALFVLASPYISIEELKRRVKLSGHLKEQLRLLEENPRPVVLMIPHFCMMESITIMPAVSEYKLPRTGVFYRPFDNAGMEKWIKSTRERYGINLLSRRDGLLVALDYVKRGDCIAILFDQDAGSIGALSMFFDRVCSCSEIAGLLVERTKCLAGVFWARRTAFWESEIDGEYIEADSAERVVIKANRWLEDKLKTDEELCVDWLWLHKRWKTQSNPRKRFRIEQRKNHLREYMDFYGLKKLPRKAEFFAALPRDEAKLLDSLAAVEALRRSRPDAALHALCVPQDAEFLVRTGLFESVSAIPEGDKSARDSALLKIKKLYPDVLINFENGAFAELARRAVEPLQCFAFACHGESSKANCLCRLDSAQSNLPYSEKLEIFMKYFGLEGEIDKSLLAAKSRGEFLKSLELSRARG